SRELPLGITNQELETLTRRHLHARWVFAFGYRIGQESQSNHGPSNTAEIYLLHCCHSGEGVERFCVAGIEPHHLLRRRASIRLYAWRLARMGGPGTRWQAHELRPGEDPAI